MTNLFLRPEDLDRARIGRTTGIILSDDDMNAAEMIAPRLCEALNIPTWRQMHCEPSSYLPSGYAALIDNDGIVAIVDIAAGRASMVPRGFDLGKQALTLN